METTATVKLVLDSREKEESRKQLKIRVAFERIPRLYSTETKVLLTKEELENPKLKAHKHAMEKVKRSLSVANEIMRRYGVLNPAKPSDYILPYLVNCTTQKSIDNKIHDVIKRINKGLESISRDLNLWKLTTYHARHTYGAHAQSVLSAEQLQKFFGHTSSRTIQTYLQSISRSVRDKNRELLESIVPK